MVLFLSPLPMEQKNLKAYLDLVQKLLNCRRGEEWIVLRQNEQLVDAQFIEVMEQVANYLAAEGELNGARYLHNWAGKLHHILTQPNPVAPQPDATTQAYAQLIEALLNCRRGEEQQILAANQKLITPDLVKFMQEVARQFEDQGKSQTAAYLQDLATAVNRTWIQTHDFQPNLQKANQLAPDPWDDSPSATSPEPMPTVSSSQPGTIAGPEVLEKADPLPTDTPTVTTIALEEVVQNLSDQLGDMRTEMAAIAQKLARVEAALSESRQASNPLAYLSVLEQAATAGWMISTDEVAQLIGVQPSPKKGKNSFERGNWRFVKAGKIGAQTGWHVEKIH
ncbi:hypothetical protein [Picosynechococcus sp. PCC 11901]|uniref:hypothetical protein n=2 Tax=Picosynechococcus TaxID=3079908 RepID=UPI0030DB2416